MRFNLFSRSYLDWEDYKKMITAREYMNFITKTTNDSIDNLWSRVE